MLTLERRLVRQRFDGDRGGWTRGANGRDASGMTGDDRFLIEALRRPTRKAIACSHSFDMTYWT